MEDLSIQMVMDQGRKQAVWLQQFMEWQFLPDLASFRLRKISLGTTKATCFRIVSEAVE
jgi:hypothetical protein